MSAVAQKIKKAAGAAPTEFEMQVATEIHHLEMSTSEMKADLHGLQITQAKEVEVGGGRVAIVLYVPVPQLKDFHKVQQRLVRELEKKFSGRHVVIVAQRTILPTNINRKSGSTGPRSRSRTLTTVQDSTLDDIVYPTEIVGKRMRYKTDGSKTLKVLLDPKDQVNVETKLDTFASIYSKLTNKEVVFEFPVENP
jgi:small subunit ribosomal protein S7e